MFLGFFSSWSTVQRYPSCLSVQLASPGSKALDQWKCRKILDKSLSSPSVLILEHLFIQQSIFTERRKRNIRSTAVRSTTRQSQHTSSNGLRFHANSLSRRARHRDCPQQKWVWVSLPSSSALVCALADPEKARVLSSISSGVSDVGISHLLTPNLGWHTGLKSQPLFVFPAARVQGF